MKTKETRRFIVGLLLAIVCGSGAAIHIVPLRSGIPYDWFEWISFGLCLCGAIRGSFLIQKTIN